MSRISRRFLLAGSFAAGTSAATAQPASSVTVFAAASLQTALGRIAPVWQTRSGGRIVASYGASSALARQIESGAPADIFISADERWMDYLAERRLIEPATRSNLLGNQLVLVAPKGSAVDLRIAPGFALAQALGDGRLAMGEPDSVPAGTYGRAALTTLGVWDSVRAKIAGVANVRAALALVARGEAPLGIVYRSDAVSEPGVTVIDSFPAASHPAILYPAAVIAGRSNPHAVAFLRHLRTADAQSIFASEGFSVLE